MPSVDRVADHLELQTWLDFTDFTLLKPPQSPQHFHSLEPTTGPIHPCNLKSTGDLSCCDLLLLPVAFSPLRFHDREWTYEESYRPVCAGYLEAIWWSAT